MPSTSYSWSDWSRHPDTRPKTARVSQSSSQIASTGPWASRRGPAPQMPPSTQPSTSTSLIPRGPERAAPRHGVLAPVFPSSPVGNGQEIWREIQCHVLDFATPPISHVLLMEVHTGANCYNLRHFLANLPKLNDKPASKVTFHV